MPEITLKIRILGDKVLRGKAKEVRKITPKHQQVLSEMARIMYDSSGIGLAAPQVGISERMIVVDAGSGLYKLINPKIVKREGSQALEEGCLSVPGICIKVRRAKKIVVKGEDESAKPVTINAEGLLACVFQHEIDHLRGKLIVDYASIFDKLRIGKKLKILKERSKSEKLSESEAKSCRLQL